LIWLLPFGYYTFTFCGCYVVVTRYGWFVVTFIGLFGCCYVRWLLLVCYCPHVWLRCCCAHVVWFGRCCCWFVVGYVVGWLVGYPVDGLLVYVVAPVVPRLLLTPLVLVVVATVDYVVGWTFVVVVVG